MAEGGELTMYSVTLPDGKVLKVNADGMWLNKDNRITLYKDKAPVLSLPEGQWSAVVDERAVVSSSKAAE
jgi:hypothetical protein